MSLFVCYMKSSYSTSLFIFHPTCMKSSCLRHRLWRGQKGWECLAHCSREHFPWKYHQKWHKALLIFKICVFCFFKAKIGLKINSIMRKYRLKIFNQIKFFVHRNLPVYLFAEDRAVIVYIQHIDGEPKKFKYAILLHSNRMFSSFFL